MRAVIKSSGKELAKNLNLAVSVLARAKGLLGRKSLDHGDGLWLKPCKGVHTFGMLFPIDVIVLDRNQKVIALRQELKPNRVTGLYLDAMSVMELPAGSIDKADLSKGDIIEMLA